MHDTIVCQLIALFSVMLKVFLDKILKYSRPARAHVCPRRRAHLTLKSQFNLGHISDYADHNIQGARVFVCTFWGL